MAFNPNDSRSLDRLARAVDHSRWRLEPFRIHRMNALRQFVGVHYSASGADVPVPLNLIQLACNIYLRQLVARAPRAMSSSQDPNLKPVAANMQSWMDKASDGMKLGDSLRVCVMNALFSIGIMMVGEAYAGDLDLNGVTHHFGQPFAEPVDLDDWVHDMTAKRWAECQFMGNRYRVSLEEAKSNPLFNAAARDKLTAQTRFGMNERGDTRTVTLSQSTQQNFDEYEDYCELWNIWLPREKLVLVLPYSESVEGGFAGTVPLKIIEWQGPEGGPYVPLSYCDVPNNVMPAAPLQALQDLHELVNALWRKASRQLEREKTILGYMGSATDDAERVARASDGDAVRMDVPDRAKELHLGGVRPELLAAILQSKDLFVYLAGNLDALGGLSPQAGTLGQDELLNKNSAAQIAEMQDRTVNFTQEVYRRLAKWWWNNPVLTYSATRQVEGEDIPVQIPPQARNAPFESLYFEIDPYSMQHYTPQTRLALLMQLVQQMLLPAAPLMQAQGVSLKWPELVEVIGKYGNFPDLMQIIAVGPPPQMQGPTQMAGEADQIPKMPPNTTRTNVRVNRPGMTRQGQSDVMQQLLAGGGQPNQRGMAGRPVG